jgi:four helix bundle protein
MVTHFRELRVYQQGYECSMRIFELTKTWPQEERYTLISQIRNSSRSVCSNVAEAWAKRRYRAHFVSKLTDADGEANETLSHLDFALGCGYLSRDEFDRLNQSYRAISGGLVRMMSEPESWCGPAGLVREPGFEYEASVQPTSTLPHVHPSTHLE